MAVQLDGVLEALFRHSPNRASGIVGTTAALTALRNFHVEISTLYNRRAADEKLLVVAGALFGSRKWPVSPVNPLVCQVFFRGQRILYTSSLGSRKEGGDYCLEWAKRCVNYVQSAAELETDEGKLIQLSPAQSTGVSVTV